MVRLLLLGPSFRRNAMSQPLPALERYDGIYYRVVRKHLPKARDVDVYVVTEDLELVRADQPIPYRPPTGESWRFALDAPRERVEEFRERLLELVKLMKYDEAFIALNKSFRQVMPDLTPYVGRVLAEFPGLGPKAQALKNWLLGIE